MGLAPAREKKYSIRARKEVGTSHELGSGPRKELGTSHGLRSGPDQALVSQPDRLLPSLPPNNQSKKKAVASDPETVRQCD